MKLRTWRAREKLSLTAFGAMINRSHVTVMRIERGTNPPDKDTIQAIYEATNGEVSLHDWFTEDGQPIPQASTEAAE